MYQRNLFRQFFLLSFISLFLVTCSDKIEEKVQVNLSLDQTSILFALPDAQESSVVIQTNAPWVTLAIPSADQSWCSATLFDNIIRIKVTENIAVGKERSTVISVNADGLQTAQTIRISQGASKRFIRSFTIPADINGLEDDMEGVIDHEARTVTLSSSRWIANVKHLIAVFETPARLFIGEQEQVSGVTTNSYLDKHTLRVKTDEGIVADYALITRGPMFTGLPIIKIDIDGGQEVKEKTVKLPSRFHLTVPNEHSLDMGETIMTIRGRGNTTWYMPKKPYRIDFPEKTSLFGLAKAKKWVLLANYQDPTLLMNDVAFQLGRIFGLEFNHSSIHVELFLNGTYRGNYQLTEQKEVGKGRIDIDTDGGFMVEIDSYYDEDYKFRTNHLSLPVMVAEPSLKSELEMEYIREAMQGLEDALFEADFPNNSYEEHTDVASLINFMLINELLRNQELGHPKSTYCYKEADTKIKWGPLWDFDWAFGYNEYNAYFVKKELIFYQGNIDPRAGASFFTRFMKVPGFRAKYKERWREIKPKAAEITAYIKVMAAKLDKSQAENFTLPDATPVTKNRSYQELITQMISWMEERIAFIDDEIEKI
jgi:hypothetical protein